jgi:hypothetical protein
MSRARVAPAALLILAILAPALRGDNAKDAAKLMEQARQAERDKRYDEAIKAIGDAIQLAPDVADYHGYMGWLSLLNHDYAKGVKESEAASRLAGPKKDAFYLFIAGENAYYDQDLDEATRFFKLAMSRDKLEPQNVAIAKDRLDFLAERVYDFEFRFDPKKGKGLKRPDGTFQLPLPSNERWPFQKRTKLTVIGARSHTIGEVEGNDVINLTPEGEEIVRVIMTVTVKPFSYKARMKKRTKSKDFSALVKPYVGPSEWINPDSRVLKKVVEPLKKADPEETVAEIVKYLRKQLRYIQNENLQDARDVTAEITLTRGQASCHGWSAAFAALCRTAGVPARMVVVLSAKDRDRFEYHDIVEVYFSGCGWVPIEPQPGGVIGITGTEIIRLYHYLPKRTWVGETPDQIHLFCTFGIMCADRRPQYNVKKK